MVRDAYVKELEGLEREVQGLGERVADLVTNICELVVFVTTGAMEELNPVPSEGPTRDEGT